MAASCRLPETAAQRQGPEPCYVSFAFGVPRLADLYPDEAKARADISDRVVASLTKRFVHWAFQRDDETHYPRVEIWLEERPWNICMRIVSASGGAESENKWTAAFFAPGELDILGGFPSAQRLPGEIVARFESRLLGQNEPAIRDSLKKYVPLVSAVSPPAPVPLGSQSLGRAVLPLQWKLHKDLAKSMFRLECKRPEGGLVDLFSEGQRQCSPYPGAGAPAGLVVVHRFWEREGDPINPHLGEISSLTPVRIYLYKWEFVGPLSCDELAPGIAK